MTPIKMKDTLLSTEVELYQLGLPDPFGANALIWFDGKKMDVNYHHIQI
jgi:hypothetical protein